MVGMLNAGQTNSETVPNRTNGMAADAPANGEAPPADAQQQATPEQMEQFNRFVDNAYRVIYDQNTLPKVQQGLKGEGDPVTGLSNIASMVIMRVGESALKAGIKDPVVLMSGSVEIVDELADLSERLGLHQFSQEEMDAATQRVRENFLAIAKKAMAQGGQGAAPPADGAPAAAPAGPPAGPGGAGGAPAGMMRG